MSNAAVKQEFEVSNEKSHSAHINTLMEQVGVPENDFSIVNDIAQQMNDPSIIKISEFGKAAAEHTIEYADKLLDMVTTKELDDTGNQLGNVLAQAKAINVSGISLDKSKVPFLGQLIDKIRLKYSVTMTQFNSARESIDDTVKQISIVQTNLTQRINDLDAAFEHVTVEHRMLGQHIVAGRIVIGLLQERLTQTDVVDIGDLKAQETADLRTKIDKFEHRVSDLMVLQQNALNTLPMIRLVQSNNASLVEKYNTIRTLTIPTWKRQMMLGLCLEEQTQAGDLAESIDSFTNELLKSQADQLKKNTIATAKSNQRLIIDVTTIQHCQKSLIDTVNTLLVIQDGAKEKRTKAEKQILTLRSELNRSLVGQKQLH
jgi:uncharacterized protein YaaN involved in tellurite resistance